MMSYDSFQLGKTHTHWVIRQIFDYFESWYFSNAGSWTVSKTSTLFMLGWGNKNFDYLADALPSFAL